MQRLSQGPQAARNIWGWGPRHRLIGFLPVTLLALITRTASVASESLPLLAELSHAENEVRTLCGALRGLQGHWSRTGYIVGAGEHHDANQI